MKNTGIIYKVVNTINNKIYIGLTTKTLNHRKSQHIYDAVNKHRICIFYHAIRKYGTSVFEWSVIWEGDVNILSKMEIFYIQKHNSYFKIGHGYNMTIGGERPPINLKENHHNYDHSLYCFYHINGDIEQNITYYNMRIKYSICATPLRQLINGNLKIVKGWALTKNEFNIIKSKSKYNAYSFIHKTGLKEVNITPSNMCKKYNLKSNSLSMVIHKHKQSIKGWRLCS